MNTKYFNIIKYVLICLFLYAAITKGVQFHKFTVQLSSSPLVPNGAVNLTAIAVLIAEIAAAVLLLSPKFVVWGMWLSYSIMLFFSLYIVYLLNIPEFIPCACGGILGDMGHKAHLVFNVVVTASIVPALLLFYRRQKRAIY